MLGMLFSDRSSDSRRFLAARERLVRHAPADAVSVQAVFLLELRDGCRRLLAAYAIGFSVGKIALRNQELLHGKHAVAPHAFLDEKAAGKRRRAHQEDIETKNGRKNHHFSQ